MMAFVNILLQIGSAILVKQEILKNLRVSDSLSPPSPFPKEKRFLLKKKTLVVRGFRDLLWTICPSGI